MGRYIMKAANDDSDLYVVWSTGVDAPVFYGTEAEVREYEIDRAVRQAREREEEHLERAFPHARETGTFVSHHYGSGILEGSWEDDELTVVSSLGESKRGGRLSRADLAKYVTTADDSLLVPFEDDDDV